VIEKDLYKQRGNGQDKGSALSLFGILGESFMLTISGGVKANADSCNARKETLLRPVMSYERGAPIVGCHHDNEKRTSSFAVSPFSHSLHCLSTISCYK
jgi:hypothetical protein